MIGLWGRHPYLTAVLLAASSAALLALGTSETSTIRSGEAAPLYTAVITAAAALAALGVVPISIVLGLSSPRVKILRRELSGDLRRTVALAVLWHLSTIVLAVFLFAFDSSDEPLALGRIAVVTLLVLGVEATLRAVVEFLAMLGLESDSLQVVGHVEPLPDDWVRQVVDRDGEDVDRG